MALILKSVGRGDNFTKSPYMEHLKQTYSVRVELLKMR